MSPDPATRETRLRENQAEARLAILRNRVEQHISSVGRTPESLVARSQDATRNIEKIIQQLHECAAGRDDLDLKALVSQLDDEFGPIRSRLRWHDQQIVAFAPLRAALDDTSMPDEDDAQDG